MTKDNEKSGGPLRAGIIGCGGRGRAHAEGYAEDERVEIAACADPSEEARNALAERFGVAGTWADYGEMLASGSASTWSASAPGPTCTAP